MDEWRSMLVDGDVPVLLWPEEESLRHQLALQALPRLLLLEPGAIPPGSPDALEDWMRAPADPSDLRVRARALNDLARGIARPSPRLDEDGLLWVGPSWVAMTEPQVPVMRLLLEHLDRVVRTDAIVAAYEASGGSGHPSSVRTVLRRIGERVAALQLELVTVRRRGVLLSASPAARQLRPQT